MSNSHPNSDSTRTDDHYRPDVQYHELHAFQRDLLLAIATLQAAQDGPVTGIDVWEHLETRRGESVNKSRVYQNLNGLAGHALIETHAVDDRANDYRLTEAGRQGLHQRHANLAAVLDGPAVSDGERDPDTAQDQDQDPDGSHDKTSQTPEGSP